MNLSEFFYMGGYAAFLWPAYALVMSVLVYDWYISATPGRSSPAGSSPPAALAASPWSLAAPSAPAPVPGSGS